MTPEARTADGRLRPYLPKLPAGIAKLPVRRGYPVPWFVAWIDGEPDFRLMSEYKLHQALRHNLCWICGETLGQWVTFPIGPMCAVNRTSAEPPSHKECCEWSVKGCPFLSRPHAHRRDVDREATGAHEPAGIMLARNPGVTLLWHTTRGRFRFDPRRRLFYVGDPYECTWWRAGKRATRAEVLDSIESGLPALREVAEMQGPNAVAVLDRYVAQAMELIPS